MAEQRFPDPIAREEDVLGTIEYLARELGGVLERRGEGARLIAARAVPRRRQGAPARDRHRRAAARSRADAEAVRGPARRARRRLRSGLRLRHDAALGAGHRALRSGADRVGGVRRRRGAGASDRPARRALRPAPRDAAGAAGHAHSGVRGGGGAGACGAAMRRTACALALRSSRTVSARRGRSGCSSGRSRSRRSRRCRTDRRSASTGGTSCIRSQSVRRSGAHRDGVVARRARQALTRDYFRVESKSGARVWLYREGFTATASRERRLVPARPVRMTGEIVELPITSCPRSIGRAAPPPAYAELAVTTNFSFLRGASDPEELVVAAKELGLEGHRHCRPQQRCGCRACARDGAQLKETNRQMTERHFKLAVGARLVFSDGTPDILAYPRDRAAWGRLTRLLSLGKRRAEKGDCILGLPDLLDFVEGLNLIVMPPARIHAERLARAAGPAEGGGVAGRASGLAAGMLYRGDDARRLARLAEIARQRCRSADRGQRRALSRARAPRVAGRGHLHPRASDAGDRGPAARSQCRAASQDRRRKWRGCFARRRRRSARRSAFWQRCNFSLEELRETEYADETRQGYATPQDALVAFAEAGLQAALSRMRFPPRSGMPSTKNSN